MYTKLKLTNYNVMIKIDKQDLIDIIDIKKSMWKGIKEIISLNNSNHIFSTASQLIMKQSLTDLALLMPSIII